MTDAAAPAGAPATPPPAAPPPAAPPSSAPAEPDARPQNAVAAILAKHQAREAARAAQEAAPPAEGEAKAPEGDANPPADKPGDKPEQGLSLKHAQLKAEHRTVLADREKVKGELAAAAKELGEFKAAFAPGQNHLKALEKFVGKPFKQIMEDAARGAYDERSGLTAEERAELAAAKEWREEVKRQEAEKKQKAAREDDERYAGEFLKSVEEKYPLFASADFAKAELVTRAYAELKAGRQPDLDALAAACEEDASKNLETLFGDEYLLTVLAKRSHLRQRWLKALGLDPQTAPRPASATKSGESVTGNGPRTLSHTTTQESPVPTAPPSAPEESRDEWLAGAKERFAQFKQRGRIVG